MSRDLNPLSALIAFFLYLIYLLYVCDFERENLLCTDRISFSMIRPIKELVELVTILHLTLSFGVLIIIEYKKDNLILRNYFY